MNVIRMILFRYLFSRQNRHRGRTVRIMVGLVISSVLMMCILSIMDWLQAGRMDVLRQVRSFPVTVEVEDETEAFGLVEEYGDMAHVFAYRQSQGLLVASGQSRGVVVRYIDDGYDGGLYCLTDAPVDGIWLPYRIYEGLGGKVSLTALEEGEAVRLAPRTREYVIEGYYQTRVSDFDSSTVFLPLDAAPEGIPWTVAFTQLEVDEQILHDELCSSGYDVEMWYEGESLLYSALQLEKTVMTLMLSCLYLIVAVQIVQSASMLASTKRRECVSLHLMGMDRRTLVTIFALTGLVLCLVSLALGLVAARLVLWLLPASVPMLSGASFALDIGTFSVISLVMLTLSSLSYAYAFGRNLDGRSVMEGLGT